MKKTIKTIAFRDEVADLESALSAETSAREKVAQDLATEIDKRYHSEGVLLKAVQDAQKTADDAMKYGDALSGMDAAITGHVDEIKADLESALSAETSAREKVAQDLATEIDKRYHSEGVLLKAVQDAQKTADDAMKYGDALSGMDAAITGHVDEIKADLESALSAETSAREKVAQDLATETQRRINTDEYLQGLVQDARTAADEAMQNGNLAFGQANGVMEYADEIKADLEGKMNNISAVALKNTANATLSGDINNVPTSEITYFKGVSNQTAHIPVSNGWQNSVVNIPLNSSNGVQAVAQLFFSYQKSVYFRTGRIDLDKWDQFRRLITDLDLDMAIEYLEPIVFTGESTKELYSLEVGDTMSLTPDIGAYENLFMNPDSALNRLMFKFADGWYKPVFLDWYNTSRNPVYRVMFMTKTGSMMMCSFQDVSEDGSGSGIEMTRMAIEEL
ncbi:MAG: hypothetical protein K2J15_06390 [Muribaculaceae bacterium]|nr:hypothetical protein [Muribaculaceae bacterium]